MGCDVGVYSSILLLCDPQIKILEFKMSNKSKDRKIYLKQQYIKNKEKIAQYYQDNKEDILIKAKTYQQNNKQKIAEYKKIYGKIYYAANADRIKQIKKLYRNNNKQKISIQRKKYYIENRELILEQGRKYHKWYDKINRDKINQRVRKCRENNPMFRIRENISRAINLSLRDNKHGRHWEIVVGYTVSELKKHLEKLFTGGMNWDNYGKWHIDHIIPISVHNFNDIEDIDFKRCWALNNLQPLWAKDNMSKHNKIEKDFQPSLALNGD